ncbi:MAG TPA: aminotransferase class I/II-fold pyridoxal phosphate-dependent enzyme, partial [Candidatus Acidoferrum sp.]|nr:aminotransferase class I/II-fold pyridoxal phosphate-dependent enzyme [Candidatus Acidoferrum sp.]
MLEKGSLDALRQALEKLDAGFQSLPEIHENNADTARIAEVLAATAEKLQNNYPYFHPLYAGQMLKPPHPVARLAYSLAQWINPNNHALDGGRASSAMEKEAVSELARMFGWEKHLGHLTGGGTMANLEALWVAGQLKPGKTVVASSQSHYTHQRISGVLQIPFESIPCDANARMDLDALEKRLAKGDVGTVVATMGTTATGSVDPLSEILSLRKKYAFRIHCDAAYGGYFGLANNLGKEARIAFDHIQDADSIVIDPHKHGLQPYGCGCVLFRDPAVGNLYKHDSPYTYFSSTELHLGEISLECSRPGAAAVALWATQRLFPLTKGGEFAKGLERGRQAALELHGRVTADKRFIAGFQPELDIVVFVPRASGIKAASTLSRRIFAAAAKRNLHLAVAELPS